MARHSVGRPAISFRFLGDGWAISNAIQQLIGGALFLFLGLALWFWLIPNWVEPDADLRLPVSLVPRVVAIGLALAGFATLVQGIIESLRNPTPAAEGFAPREFRGFVLMVLLLLAVTTGFQFLHFLIVAPILIAASMWMFGPLNPVSLVLTSALGPLLIWALGTQLLGRVLP